MRHKWFKLKNKKEHYKEIGDYENENEKKIELNRDNKYGIVGKICSDFLNKHQVLKILIKVL